MKRMKLWLLIITLLPLAAIAQQKQVREGNKLYEQKKYKEAAAAYQQGLQKAPGYVPGAFNLGNALYQQKNFEGTRKVLDATSKASKDKAVKADAAYNIGNTYMSEQKWDEAINSYKQTLRNNPGDEAAKYNLSYANAMKKKQDGGGGGKNNKDQKDQQDKQNQQQQNKDQKDKGDQKQDQQKQPQDNKEQQDQQKPQPQPSKLSEEQADQLLDALAQEEKKLHDKKKEGKATQAKLDKDW